MTTATKDADAASGNTRTPTQKGNLYFSLELKVNKCKFYRNPSNPLAVLAGDVASVPIFMLADGDSEETDSKIVILDATSTSSITSIFGRDDDNNKNTALTDTYTPPRDEEPVRVIDHPDDYEYIRHELQIGTRCLVHLRSSSGQVPYLMKKWASECRDKRKSTNWTEIAEHRVTFRIDIDGDVGVDNDTNIGANSIASVLEKCRSVPGAWMLRSTKGITRICNPPTVKVTMLMDQSKFYPTKLALLDGVILDVDRNAISATTLEIEENSTAGLLENGERCWLHVRSNVLSLLKTLHGESMAGDGNSNTGDSSENNHHTDNNDLEKKAIDNNGKVSTGWVQLARAIPVVCEVIINEDLLRRKANMKGALLLECHEIIDIQKDTSSSSSYPDEITQGMSRTKGIQDNYSKQSSNSILPPTSSTINNTRADRKERHRIFAEWLVKTYGADFLSTGSGVLDVAGGNGALGNELWKLGVCSTLLDPEPRCDIDSVPFRVIGKPLVGNGSELTGEIKTKNSMDTTKDGIVIETDGEKERIKHLVETCSIIAGMHPDEATEAVIDTSLRLGKPFAILPCCVFRNLNSERIAMRKQKQQQHGTGATDPFRSYSTFCHFLLHDKAPLGIRFETENLSFEGRNKVVFVKSYFFQCQEIIEP